jgi:hypothetical protein
LKRTLIVSLSSLLFLAVPAFADPVGVQLTGVQGGYQGGVYVTPYYLSINGGTPIDVVCDDYTHEVWVGEAWSANVSTFSNLGDTRWGSSDTQQYDEAAWLYEQYLNGNASAGDVNFAIWSLFDPQLNASTPGWDQGVSNLLSWAGQWYSDGAGGVNFSDFMIITPTDGGPGSPQEYLAVQPTPEPGTLVLMGSGLLLLAIFARKKSRPTAQASEAS